MKKLIIMLLILLLIGGGAYLYHINKDNNIPEYQKNKYKEKLEFKTNEEKQEFVNEFASDGEILDEENEDYPYVVGGFTTANIPNVVDVLDYLGIEGMVFVKEELTLALEMLPKLKEDTRDLEVGELKRYFSEHENKIIKQYGITTLDKFQEFVESLAFIKENEKISEGVINTSSIEKVGNTVLFDLVIKDRAGNTNTYKIKVDTIPSGENVEFSLYWEVG